MSAHLTSEQEWEQIRHWLSENGLSLLGAIILSLCALFAFKHLQTNRERALEHASRRYEELLGSIAQSDATGMEQHANYLITRYPKSAYAKLAKLLLAGQAIHHNNLKQAEDFLRSVMNTAEAPALREIARLRLARIWITKGKTDLALRLIHTVDDKNYRSEILEVKGDIFLAKNDTQSAQKSYTEALSLLDDSDSTRALLQMKLDAIPASSVGAASA